MMRTILLVALLQASGVSQLVVTDPNLQVSTMALQLPGARHQIGTDTTGNVYVAEEILGGALCVPIHRVDPQGVLTTNWVLPTGVVRSVGQMVTNPTNGLCHFIDHLVGALEHNYLVRIEPGGTVTVLLDSLWGIGHGLTRDSGGDWYIGTATGVGPPGEIRRIPSTSFPTGPEVFWASGQGANTYLAPATGGGLLCADSGSIWSILPNQPNTTVYTHIPLPGATFGEWRGLVGNPFGQGHVASLLETVPGTGVTIGRVLWIGPGGPLELAQGPASTPGDFAIAADGGSLLVISQGALYRLTLSAPAPIAPGLLQAPTNPPAAVPFTVVLTGRPFALSPFILAADLPLGPPAFPGGVLPLPPFGVVHTSLGLQTTFVALRDGLGLFSPLDPSAMTGPGGTWTETFVIPASLIGTTLVLQGYIVDDQAPNTLFWITNPVYLTGS